MNLEKTKSRRFFEMPFFLVEALKIMSRSKRKTSIIGTAVSCSEKRDKTVYNRRYRHACKQFLQIDCQIELLPHLKEYSNPWSMSKDGRSWFDAKKFPEMMRK